MRLSELEKAQGLPDMLPLCVSLTSPVDLMGLSFVLDAEGNGDSVSPAAHAERIALLSSLLTQTHIHADNLQSPSNRTAFAPSSVASPPLLQSMFSGEERRAGLHAQTSMQPKRMFPAPTTISDFSSGNIVYQTPLTPVSSARYPLQLDDPLASNVHLPSFLKYQPKQPGARSPVSLSPTSTSSADLSFDEYDDVPPSPASFRPAHGLYSRHSAGSGAMSTASGSTSSLTLPGGNNIWALNRGENKSWTAVALPCPEFLAGPKRTSSREVLSANGL